MVYNIRNDWDFGLCPLGVLETRKHDVSETGFHSQVKGGKTPTQLGPLERANLNHWKGQKT
jgi:hypothetical protein